MPTVITKLVINMWYIFLKGRDLLVGLQNLLLGRKES